MKAKILRLKPNSRFHFGRPLIDSDASLTDTDLYLHSDVLFSALVNNLSSVKDQDEVERFVNAFKEGAIKISSAGYCLQKMDDGEIVYLIPKPVSVVNGIDANEYDEIKLVKKVQFVNYALLSEDPAKWETNGFFSVDNLTLTNLGFGKDYYYISNDPERRTPLQLFRKVFDTKVGLRSTKESNRVDGGMQSKGPYNVSAIEIADLGAASLKVHFYFLYEIFDPQFEDDFEVAVTLLQFNGIGGERSSGYGQIESVSSIEQLPPYFTAAKEGSYQLTLSKVIPKDVVELSCFKAYSHSIRGGRHSQDGYLKSVRMINEGAIIHGDAVGEIKSISPENTEIPYYRNGCCFTIALPDDFKLR